VITRRDVLHLGLAACVPRPAVADPKASMLTRPIPKSGEQLPVIGMGTWQTFDADPDPTRAEVVTAFLDAGARVIDSSPMYGRAEETTGDLLAKTGKLGVPFLATKVWTKGKQAGIDQMTRSMTRMRAQRIDLMQVHNLVDVATHLPVLRDWKQAGKIRYLGVTHHAHGAFDEIERLMRGDKLDFIQIPYNIADREAEKRVLPAAVDTGTAVLVMTPFEAGGLFSRVKSKPLPAIAAELDCTSWAQLFLKFILGHPAVTCPIPATAKPEHVRDNVKAGSGRLPDAAQRAKLASLL
jgi:aryl-alcohol dehydrogenase-like predicted oxidoreductase